MNTLIAGLVLLGVLIFFHELGHFIVAKLSGVRVLTFSLGFGPRLIGFTRGDTEYKISAIPLGGYVRMYGDDPTEELPEEEKKYSFLHQPVWRKSAIAAAGPIANFILPVVVLWAVIIGPEKVPSSVVGTVFPEEPAAAAGLRPGDKILTVDGHTVSTFDDLVDQIKPRPDQRITLEVEREGEKAPISLVVQTKGEKSADLLSKGEVHGKIGIASAVQKARIAVTDPQSPAARAGLKTFDEIVEVDGVEVKSMAHLEEILAFAGDKTLQIKAVYTPPPKRPLTPDEKKKLKEEGKSAKEIQALQERAKPEEARMISLGPALARGGEKDEASNKEVDAAANGADGESDGAPNDTPAAPKIAEAGAAPSGHGVADELLRYGVTADELAKADLKKRLEATRALVAVADAELEKMRGIAYVGGTLVDVLPESPAATLALASGHRVVGLDGRNIRNWTQFQAGLDKNPDGIHVAAVLHGGKSQMVAFRQKVVESRGRNRGMPDQRVFGHFYESAYATGALLTRDVGATEALKRAFVRTGALIGITIKGLKMLITREVPVSGLGGPLMIFDLAGQASEHGLGTFISLLALISVNLGILNLLPIPVLDGGHLLMFSIEAIRRRPLDLKTRMTATRIGFGLLMVLMATAIINDFLRYLLD
jgi:RIP metalloprotease RseP